MDTIIISRYKLGKTAYEAYRASIKVKHMMPFDEMSEEYRQHWINVGVATFQASKHLDLSI